MQLRAVREAHFLTFEDVDYKGDANMVGERNWSSLIDSQQYGGPLLYPKNNQLYNWSDANNTFLLPNFLTDGVITNTGVADTQFPIIWIWILLMETSSTN